MQDDFAQEYPEFRLRLDDFILSTFFHSKRKEYQDLAEQMSSVSDEQMKVFTQDIPEFMGIYEQSLSLIHEIVSLHQGLDEIFSMDEETLGSFCQYDLREVDKRVSKDLQEIALLLKQFEMVSEKGKKTLEHLNDPFLTEGI